MEGVYIVRVEARPAVGTKEHGRVAGAFINIYTTAATEADALSIATAELDASGWEICSVDEVFWLTRARAQKSPDSLPYFEQALLDDIALVFHTYSHAEEAVQVVH